MKVGEYARYKYEDITYIGKITFISEVMLGLDETLAIDIDNCMEEVYKNDIIKSSTNIMDLIEVGDFITYKKGNMYIDIPYRVYGTYNEILEETELRIDDEYLKDIEILSIVTHEQFERMQYNLESEVN